MHLMLNRVRHGDLTLPEELQDVGMSIESSLIKPLDPQNLMLNHLNEQEKLHNQRVIAEEKKVLAATLAQNLAMFKVIFKCLIIIYV